MNKSFIDKRVMLCTSVLVGVLSLSGCGNTSEEEKELAAFSSSVAEFADYIQEIDEQINSLDVSRKESADELLELLDDMNAKFAAFAMVSAPGPYESIPGLATQASEEMSRAVSYYHTAYESEVFNENYADAAYQCYVNSMEAVKYMGMLLLGEEISEGDHITVHEITNDENLLDKWLSDDKNDESPENETASVPGSEAVN